MTGGLCSSLILADDKTTGLLPVAITRQHDASHVMKPAPLIEYKSSPIHSYSMLHVLAHGWSGEGLLSIVSHLIQELESMIPVGEREAD